MAAVFLSYSREDRARVAELTRDIQQLGHSLWLDQELRGGQPWWDRILASIRSCDVLVVAVSAESLRSVACRREYEYAAALGKPILPVVLGEGISTSLLPPALSRIQLLDDHLADRTAGLQLAKALSDLPVRPPLPEPLPPEPEVPISYLSGLAERVGSVGILSYEQQSVLLLELRRSCADPETAADGRTLLRQLRSRRDLYAAIAEEIDRLARPDTEAVERRDAKEEGSAHERRAQPRASDPPSVQERARAAVLGGIAGVLVGFGAVIAEKGLDDRLLAAIPIGAGAAIAGFLVGLRPTGAAAAIAGAVGAVQVMALALPGNKFLYWLFYGAPWGLVLGALAHAVAHSVSVRIRRSIARPS